MQLDNLVPQHWELRDTNKFYLAISDKQDFSVLPKFQLEGKMASNSNPLYDGGCNFTAVLEVICLNVALKLCKSLIPQRWELQTAQLHG